MIKAVIDTNVFVSGLLKGRITRPIINAFKNSKFVLIISPPILKEILEVISRPKFHNFITKEMINELKELIETQAFFVKPKYKLNIVKEDPEDNKFLETAIVGRANFIISTDKHLLNLKSFHNISIIKPSQFLKTLRKK